MSHYRFDDQRFDSCPRCRAVVDHDGGLATCTECDWVRKHPAD